MRTGSPLKEVATEEQGRVDDAWIVFGTNILVKHYGTRNDETF